jgi:hypothetical protein
MADERIIGYLRKGINKGHSIESLKQQLLGSGFQKNLIDEAALELKGPSAKESPEKPKETSPTEKISPEEPKKPKEENLIEEVPGLDNNSNTSISKYSGERFSKKSGVFWKIGKSIVSPGELFESVKYEGIWPPLKYYLILLLIPFIATTLGTLFFIGAFTNLLEVLSINIPHTGALLTTISILVFAALIFIAIPILTFIAAGILHLTIKIYGGDGSFADTFGIIVYSSTPSVLFGFIPIIPIWSIVLNVIGVSKNHSISKLRAILALLTPGILLSIATTMLWYFLPDGTITVGSAG